MQGRRIDRMGHLIQMELSQSILTKLKDPRLGFVTITHVTITPDMKEASVFFSVMGDEKKKEESKIALEHAKGFLQREIATHLHLRFAPKLNFQYDDSLDRSFEI